MSNGPPQSAYLELHNYQSHPVQLFIEPWGEEYFLMPGDKVALQGTGKGDRPYFGLDFSTYQVTVWAEGGIGDVQVSKNGEPLEIGCNFEAWHRFCKAEGVDPGSACKSEPSVLQAEGARRER